MTDTRTVETFSRAVIVSEALLDDAGDGFVTGFLVESFAAELTRRGWVPILDSGTVAFLSRLDLLDLDDLRLDLPAGARVAIVKMRAA